MEKETEKRERICRSVGRELRRIKEIENNIMKIRNKEIRLKRAKEMC